MLCYRVGRSCRVRSSGCIVLIVLLVGLAQVCVCLSLLLSPTPLGSSRSPHLLGIRQAVTQLPTAGHPATSFSIIQTSAWWHCQQCVSAYWKAMIEALQQHPNYVSDPARAQLLFIDHDTLRHCSWPDQVKLCRDAGVREAPAYTALLCRVFDVVTWRKERPCHWPSFRGEDIFMDTVGSLAVQYPQSTFVYFSNVNSWSAAVRDTDRLKVRIKDLGISLRYVGFDLHFSHIDWGTDVNLLPVLFPGRASMVEALADRVQCQKRPYLACFSGRRTTEMRSRVYNLHNPLAGIFVQETSDNVTDGMFSTRLRKSTFAFSPRGDSHYSFRLTEILAAGAIPVVIDDDFTPPFGERNISSWAVWLPEADIERSEERLRSLSAEDVCNMRRGGARVFEYARDIPGLVEGMLLGLSRTL